MGGRDVTWGAPSLGREADIGGVRRPSGRQADHEARSSVGREGRDDEPILQGVNGRDGGV
jgi:hypothetical protein